MLYFYTQCAQTTDYNPRTRLEECWRGSIPIRSAARTRVTVEINCNTNYRISVFCSLSDLTRTDSLEDNK